ncbi:hypothetical protein Atai01_83010 [Amycolatopsis taiwanensis]|uniref:Uncharacterized protein n=1 Tax=Amycolatopsis taiwanensis TaxID=342230 RepID=A0A9W6RCT1_9PSEU|nr:hypothetical protein Atai01_83010 [Amycolatopsis taiwanensis]
MLNAPTILRTIGTGQLASRPIAVALAVQTVAGVGVSAELRGRVRVVAAPGLAGLILVVVGAVG